LNDAIITPPGLVAIRARLSTPPSRGRHVQQDGAGEDRVVRSAEVGIAHVEQPCAMTSVVLHGHEGCRGIRAIDRKPAASSASASRPGPLPSSSTHEPTGSRAAAATSGDGVAGVALRVAPSVRAVGVERELGLPRGSRRQS
jgi:hypothetical protein